MKFFIDTANLEQIKEAQALGVLDGVTTNPSLMAKEGISGKENIKKHYMNICEIVDGDGRRLFLRILMVLLQRAMNWPNCISRLSLRFL